MTKTSTTEIGALFMCRITANQRVNDIIPPKYLLVVIIKLPLIDMLLKLRTKISLVRIINNGNNLYPSIIKKIIDIQLRYLSLNKSSSFPPVLVSLNFFAK